MIHIHICEDSEHQIKQIHKALKDSCALVSEDMKIVTVTRKPEELLDAVGRSHVVNVYFLDIDLKHKSMNGFQVAMKIREKEPFAYICFVTTHSEMSYLTFKYKVMAFDFIIKDTYENLKRDFLSCLWAIHQQVGSLKNNEEEYLELDLFHEKRVLPMDSILAVEVVGNHKIKLYTDTQTIEMSRTLTNMKKELPPHFIKCHRSILINGKRITRFDSSTGKIVVGDQVEFYTAIRKKREINQWLEKRG